MEEFKINITRFRDSPFNPINWKDNMNEVKDYKNDVLPLCESNEKYTCLKFENSLNTIKSISEINFRKKIVV